MSQLKKFKGLSLIELVGVMAIIVILVGVSGFAISNNVKKTNREAVMNELQLFVTDLSDAYYDLGAPEIDPTSPGGVAEFARFLGVLTESYLSVTFDLNSIVATSNGFEVDIKAPLDVYEQKYHCWFTTTGGTSKYIMVASGGDNTKIESAGYSTQNYSDDIVLVIKP